MTRRADTLMELHKRHVPSVIMIVIMITLLPIQLSSWK
jgi:hypothetical protein